MSWTYFYRLVFKAKKKVVDGEMFIRRQEKLFMLKCAKIVLPHSSRSTTISFYWRHSSRNFFPLRNARLLVTSGRIKKSFFLSPSQPNSKLSSDDNKKKSFLTLFSSIILSRFYFHPRKISSKMLNTKQKIEK
jgi:hypothetical protein